MAAPVPEIDKVLPFKVFFITFIYCWVPVLWVWLCWCFVKWSWFVWPLTVFRFFFAMILTISIIITSLTIGFQVAEEVNGLDWHNF